MEFVKHCPECRVEMGNISVGKDVYCCPKCDGVWKIIFIGTLPKRKE